MTACVQPHEVQMPRSDSLVRNPTLFSGLGIQMGITSGWVEEDTPVEESAMYKSACGNPDHAVLLDMGTYIYSSRKCAALLYDLSYLSKFSMQSLVSSQGRGRSLVQPNLVQAHDNELMPHQGESSDTGSSGSSSLPSGDRSNVFYDIANRQASQLVGNQHTYVQMLGKGDKVMHLYQILAPTLVQRAKLFGSTLKLAPEWICVEQPYFSAPCTQVAPIVMVNDPMNGVEIPKVTMVFCSMSEGRRYRSLHFKDSQKVHDVCSSVMRNTLRSVPGGYLCRLLDGALKYMLSFHSAHAALTWCLTAQESFLYAKWPKSALGFWPETRDEHGCLDFRGPRMKMGLCEGSPQTVFPDHLGRADYIGTSVNQAARCMDAGAHGGQVVCCKETALKALSVMMRKKDVPRNQGPPSTPLPYMVMRRNPSFAQSPTSASQLSLPSVTEDHREGGETGPGERALLPNPLQSAKDWRRHSASGISCPQLPPTAPNRPQPPPARSSASDLIQDSTNLMISTNLMESSLASVSEETGPFNLGVQAEQHVLQQASYLRNPLHKSSDGRSRFVTAGVPLSSSPHAAAVVLPSSSPNAPAAMLPSISPNASASGSMDTSYPADPGPMHSREVSKFFEGTSGIIDDFNLGLPSQFLQDSPRVLRGASNQSIPRILGPIRLQAPFSHAYSEEIEAVNEAESASASMKEREEREERKDKKERDREASYTLVSARYIGLFQFKGDPTPIKMVQVSSETLSRRVFPSVPPKGKGVRLSEADELVKEVFVALPQVVAQYRAVYNSQDEPLLGRVPAKEAKETKPQEIEPNEDIP
eukprot:gene8123-1370_t